MSTHKTATIKKIVKENKDIWTFFLDLKLDYKPGQFVMVWIPGLDEKPYSLSYTDPIAITVEKKGNFSEKLFKMKVGNNLFIRGPFGNGFPIKKKDAIVVAGGCGYAPLSPLIESLEKPRVIFGCKNKERIVFADRFKDLKPVFCTDDGSFGCKGFTSEVLIEEIKKKKPKVVYTCGPEIMMKKIVEICEKEDVECYASLERMMFCGFGVCGSCTCGKGKLVCKDGPVFSSKELKDIDDFGKTAKLRSGKKVSLKEFYEWRS